MSFTEQNHYVPQWHQRRFFSPQTREPKLYYLDLHPEKVKLPSGKILERPACRRLGPPSCFVERNLYTLLFGSSVSDLIEKRFFGEIDRRGAAAAEFFGKYTWRNGWGDHIQAMVTYLDAQKLRTPKGLDFIKALARTNSHQAALYWLGQLTQLQITIWMEGVWEVLACDNSSTKFIVSDHPVTTYNKKLFPGAKECRYPHEAPIEFLGTHTIFPLNLNRCLVITNLGYVRNPECNRTKPRENSRYFENTIFDVRKVQIGRQLPERDVQAINYILKQRARRFIAAGEESWLYPEASLKTRMWDKLGDQFFLMPDPRKVSFSTGMFVGWKDGSAWGSDEYGRAPHDGDPRVEAQRAVEWETFQSAKQKWDLRFGRLSGEEMRRYF